MTPKLERVYILDMVNSFVRLLDDDQKQVVIDKLGDNPVNHAIFMQYLCDHHPAERITYFALTDTLGSEPTTMTTPRRLLTAKDAAEQLHALVRVADCGTLAVLFEYAFDGVESCGVVHGNSEDELLCVKFYEGFDDDSLEEIT